MSHTIDLSNGKSVFLIINGQTLNIKSDDKNKNFIINSLDSDLILKPDSNNRILICADGKNSKKIHVVNSKKD